MGIKAALPKYEIYFYNTVLCLAMFWAAGWIFEVSSCKYAEGLLCPTKDRMVLGGCLTRFKVVLRTLIKKKKLGNVQLS